MAEVNVQNEEIKLRKAIHQHGILINGHNKDMYLREAAFYFTKFI